MTLYFNVSGVGCLIMSSIFLIPDAFYAIRRKCTAMSNSYLILKSVYIATQFNYSIALWEMYGWNASVYLWVGLSFQMASLGTIAMVKCRQDYVELP